MEQEGETAMEELKIPDLRGNLPVVEFDAGGYRKMVQALDAVALDGEIERTMRAGHAGLIDFTMAYKQNVIARHERGKGIELMDPKISGAKGGKVSLGNDTLTPTQRNQRSEDMLIAEQFTDEELHAELQTARGVAPIVKEARKRKAAAQPPTPPPLTPDGELATFDLIYADPPWKYDFAETDNRQIENQYPTMVLNDICDLDIPAQDNAVLYLWTTTAKLVEGLEVLEAWGFTYKSSMVWIKDRIGMGYHARGRHEFLLIGTRGTPGTPAPENRPDSVIEAPRGQHSAKPKKVYDIIEKAWPDTTKLEMFARTQREGWTAWGNEA